MRPIAKFKKRTVVNDGKEEIDVYWVLGKKGVVSTWFETLKPHIDVTICSGLVWHYPYKPSEDAIYSEACEFMESRCWYEVGSSLIDREFLDAYDRGDDESIFAWLYGAYLAVLDPDTLDAMSENESV